MKNPTVTFCIPTYNRPEFLRRAIKSVLGQTIKEFSLLIGDDNPQGSNEKVVAEFKDERVKYIKNDKNLGFAKNIAKLYDQTASRYLVFLNDDDLIAPEYLEECLKVFRYHPDLGYLFVEPITVAPDGRVLFRYFRTGEADYLIIPPKELIHHFIYYGKRVMGKYKFALSFSSTMFSKEALEKTGGLATGTEIAIDKVIMTRVALLYEVGVMFKPLFNYTFHQNLSQAVYARGEYLAEELKFIQEVDSFIQTKNISLNFEFNKFARKALINYFFRPDGGLTRLAANYQGGYLPRTRVILKTLVGASKVNKDFWFSPMSYLVIILALITPKIIFRKVQILYWDVRRLLK